MNTEDRSEANPLALPEQSSGISGNEPNSTTMTPQNPQKRIQEILDTPADQLDKMRTDPNIVDVKFTTTKTKQQNP